MAKKFEVEISFNGRATVDIYAQPGETIDDILKLSSADIFDRILDAKELVDFIDEDDVDLYDVKEVNDGE